MKKYSVSLWGSEPGTNDDCWFGDEYDTLEEAEDVFADPSNNFELDSDCVFVELDGPDVYQKRRLIPDLKVGVDREWQREFAMQTGMEFGIQGYNDAMEGRR